MLSGSWGQGKSTIVNLLMNRLEKTSGITCEKISAWKYEATSARRAFLRDVWAKVGGREPHYQERVRSIVAREKKDKPLCISEIIVEMVTLVGRWALLFAIMTVPICIAAIAVSWVSLRHFPKALDAGWRFTRALLGSFAVGALSGPIITSLSPKQGLRNWSIVLPPITADEFEGDFTRQLKVYAKRYKRNHHGQSLKKLVMIVDDIDRLTVDRVKDVLVALKAFVESNDSCIFLVPCDEAAVVRAFEPPNCGNDSVRFDRIGRDFLEKLFQFKVTIAPTMARDMLDYGLAVVQEEAPDLAERLGYKCRDVIEILIQEEISSPRQVKKIINAFSSRLAVADSREGPEGKIGEPIVSQHLDFLAVLTVIEELFPDFYGDLLRYDGLLGAILESYQGYADRVPEYLKTPIKKYEALDDDEKAKGNRRLMRFLWANSHTFVTDNVTAFLYLGQDSVGRQIGDQRMRELRNALWNADDNFVRSQFRDSETNMLSAASVQMILDELRTRTGNRIVNTGRTVVNLWDLIPADHVSNLGPLVAQVFEKHRDRCHQLATNKLLRVLSDCPDYPSSAELVDYLVESVLVKCSGWPDLDGNPMSGPDLKDLTISLIQYLLRHHGSLSPAAVSATSAFLRHPEAGTSNEEIVVDWSTYKSLVLPTIDVVAQYDAMPVFDRIVELFEEESKPEDSFEVLDSLLPTLNSTNPSAMWLGLIRIAKGTDSWDVRDAVMKRFEKFAPCPADVATHLLELLWGDNTLCVNAGENRVVRAHALALVTSKDCEISEPLIERLTGSMSELLEVEDRVLNVKTVAMIRDYAVSSPELLASPLLSRYVDKVITPGIGLRLVFGLPDLAPLFSETHLTKVSEWLQKVLSQETELDTEGCEHAKALCISLAKLGQTRGLVLDSIRELVIKRLFGGLGNSSWVNMVLQIIDEIQGILSTEDITNVCKSLASVLEEDPETALRAYLSIAGVLDEVAVSSVADSVMDEDLDENNLSLALEFLRRVRDHLATELRSRYLDLLIESLPQRVNEVSRDLINGFREVDTTHLASYLRVLLEQPSTEMESCKGSIGEVMASLVPSISDISGLVDVVVMVAGYDSPTADWLLTVMLEAMTEQTRGITLDGVTGKLAQQETPQDVRMLWGRLRQIRWTSRISPAYASAVVYQIALRGDEFLEQGLLMLTDLYASSGISVVQRRDISDALYKCFRHSQGMKRKVAETTLRLGLLAYAKPVWLRRGVTIRERRTLESVVEKERKRHGKSKVAKDVLGK